MLYYETDPCFYGVASLTLNRISLMYQGRCHAAWRRAVAPSTPGSRLQSPISAVGQPHSPSDRRKEPRFPADENGKLKSLPPLEISVSSIEIVNRSARGMRLRTVRGDLPVGAWIQVRTENEVILGQVRYCNSDGNGFFVGVKIYDSVCP